MFGGWYTDPDYTMAWTGGMMPACDLTLYARMLPISDVLYAVDVPEAGTPDERLPEGYALYALDQLAEGETLLPPTPEAEGRIFDGWYLDAEGAQALNPTFDRMPAEDLIVYGKFVPQVDALFVLNLPSDTAYQSQEIPEGFSLYETVTETIGQTFSAPAEPVTEGYVFTGWFEEPTFEHEWTSRAMPRDGAMVFGRMTRLRAGGVYTLTDAGYVLKRYVLEQDESSEVYLPAKVNGIPVVSIAAYAFREDKITKLHLPENLVFYDNEAFSGMSKLTAFAISENNPNFATKDGVLYSKDMTVLYRYPRGKTSRSFTVPQSVTAIAPRAFEQCSKLQTILLPDGLTAIGEHAFDGCSALTAIALPDGVTAIEAGTFANCGSLLSLTAYGVTRVADQAIPFNMDMNIRGQLGGGALRDYCVVRSDDAEAMLILYNMRRVKLYIDGKLFTTALCEAGMKLPAMMESGQRDDGSWITGWFTDSALTTPWTFASDLMPDEDIVLYTASRPVYESVEQTFVVGTETAEDGTVTELTRTGLLLTAYHGAGGVLMIPRTMNGLPVLGLGENFLASANGVVEVIDIGRDVIYIADTALVGPAAYPFKGVVRADAGSYAAQWASQKGYEVMGSVYTLSFETYGAQIAAKQAGAGTVIKLPTPAKSGATFMGWYMDEFLGEPVVLDEDGLFTMPPYDITLYAAWDGEGEIYPFSYEERNGSVVVTGYLGISDTLVIPETVNGLPVTAIGDSAFEDDTLLRSVSLPDNVKQIGSRAFAGSAVRSVNLGGTTDVGDSAFARCTQLSSVTMNRVENIGTYAFRGCIVLRTLNLPDSLRTISAGAYMGCTGIGSVTLPANVEAVQENAFSGCVSLKQAHLGMAYYVDARAFDGCTALHTYTTDEDNPAYSAQDGLLMTADGTTLVRYPIAKADASYTIPDGVTDVADSAFAGAKHLASVTVPASVSWIGYEAFRDCVKLTAFELPADSKVSMIAQNTFSGCASLEQVRLSASVKAIEENAFSGCTMLVKVEIPMETTSISETAFSGNRQMLIVGKVGSAAHQYAKEQGYLFLDPDAPQVQTLTLTAERTVLQRGEMIPITLTSEPADALEAATITWHCDQQEVVLVENGVVHAIGGGFAEVTAQADNGVTGSITIEVQVAAQAVSLMELPRTARGVSIQAEAIVLPESATNKECTWESSDESVFVVDETGLVTCMGEGTATLTATTHNGLMTQTTVTGFNAVETIAVTIPEETLYAVEGLNTLQLEAIALPQDATDATLLYATSDETVLSVDETGLVTAHMPGRAVITVTAADGGGATCEVEMEVSGRDLSVLTLPEQEPIVYDTLAHQPQIILEMDGLLLEESVDYVITIGDAQEGDEPELRSVEAIDVGVYPFTVTGVGKYCGTLYGELTIEKAQTTLVYTGETVHRLGSVLPSYTLTPPVAADVTYMRVEEDGTLTEIDAFPTEAGEYRMDVAVADTENCTSAELSAQFTLVDDWFSIAYHTLHLRRGQSVQLVNTQLPQELAPVPVTYVSGNTAVARVDAAGRITAGGNGTTTITVTTQGGEGVKRSFTVTVSGLEQTLTLPGMLQEVEAEAFEGMASVQVLMLGERLKAIGHRAFADMTALRQVHLPVSVEGIADDAFAGTQDLTIFCEEGSEAQRYAERTGIPYVLK